MSESTTSGQHGTTAQPESSGVVARLLAVGGFLGALAASLCCIAPLVLFSLGIGGAWIGNLTALSQYHDWFVVVTIGLLGTGYWQVYRKKGSDNCCEEGSYCASPASGRFMKFLLWGATFLIVTIILFPYAAPYLLAE